MEINYQTIYDYLRFGRYQCGSSDNQKRATRNKAKKFTIQDGVLNYMSKSGPRQWITEAEQQLKIIGACHADKLGGHFGRDKTREKIASRLVTACYSTLSHAPSNLLLCHRKLLQIYSSLSHPNPMDHADTIGAT